MSHWALIRSLSRLSIIVLVVYALVVAYSSQNISFEVYPKRSKIYLGKTGIIVKLPYKLHNPSIFPIEHISINLISKDAAGHPLMKGHAQIYYVPPNSNKEGFLKIEWPYRDMDNHYFLLFSKSIIKLLINTTVKYGGFKTKITTIKSYLWYPPIADITRTNVTFLRKGNESYVKISFYYNIPLPTNSALNKVHTRWTANLGNISFRGNISIYDLLENGLTIKVNEKILRYLVLNGSTLRIKLEIPGKTYELKKVIYPLFNIYQYPQLTLINRSHFKIEMSILNKSHKKFLFSIIVTSASLTKQNQFNCTHGLHHYEFIYSTSICKEKCDIFLRLEKPLEVVLWKGNLGSLP